MTIRGKGLPFTLIVQGHILASSKHLFTYVMVAGLHWVCPSTVS